jgi:hypothetical protein
LIAAWALLACSLAQALPSEANRGPKDLILPAYLVHLHVDEELEPDALRSLARKGTVLWLSTRSNMLRASAVERLNGFPDAYVEMRSPVLEQHARQMQKAPHVGILLAVEDLGGEGLYRLGGRRLAVRLRGPISEETADKVKRAKPQQVLWSATPDEADVLSWSRLAQLPGKKQVHIEGEGAFPAPGCLRPGSFRGVIISRRLADALAHGSGPGADDLSHNCGIGTRVEVPVHVSNRELAALYSADPTVELELNIGSNGEKASAAGQLFARLEAAAP